MKLIAVHQIQHNWSGAIEVTGRVNDAGEPIIRAVTEEIAPGAIFEVPPEHAGQRERLLELGAARMASAEDLAAAQDGAA